MPVMSGGLVTQPGQILFQEVVFTIASGTAAGTFTGSVTVPGGAWILDIKLFCEAYFNQGTTASMIVGDAADPDGWFTAVDVKGTDIVAGTDAEVIDFNNPGGTEGAYLVTATGERAEMYSSAERVITGVITTVGTAATTGELHMVVLYTDPTVPTIATFVAT